MNKDQHKRKIKHGLKFRYSCYADLADKVDKGLIRNYNVLIFNFCL